MYASSKVMPVETLFMELLMIWSSRAHKRPTPVLQSRMMLSWMKLKRQLVVMMLMAVEQFSKVLWWTLV